MYKIMQGKKIVGKPTDFLDVARIRISGTDHVIQYGSKAIQEYMKQNAHKLNQEAIQ